MVTFAAWKSINNQTMVICDYHGILWQKSNIGFWVNFQFQNRHKFDCRFFGIFNQRTEIDAAVFIRIKPAQNNRSTDLL